MARVTRVALFRFNEGTRPAEVQFVLDSVRKLTTTFPGIEHFAVGRGASSESGNDGFTHGSVMTFTDAHARDAYLKDPDHLRVQGEVVPFVARAVIFDFEE